MSDLGPLGSGGPFGDLMRNLARMLTSQGPVNWDIAQQLAVWGASGGEAEPNPDPLSRARLEELLRVAEMHVAEATGLDPGGRGGLRVAAVTRSEWAQRTLLAWRPLLEQLAGAMTPPAGEPAGTDVGVPDPMAELLGNLPQVLGPFLLGMHAGSMVGQLAHRAMGAYDLPMPRPAGDELLFVPLTIDAFAEEWSLQADDVRMWICLRETVNHAVLARPHVRARLEELIGEYVSAFEPDPRAIEERLSGFDPTDMAAMQSMFGDPEALLGDMTSDTQRAVQVPLSALLAAVTGYVDHVMDTVGRRLVGGYGPLTEALHRRRLEEDAGSRILGRMMGINLDAEGYERGQRFVAGIVERVGESGLDRLWHSAHELPTPAEIDAPGLWLARIDLDLPPTD